MITLEIDSPDQLYRAAEAIAEGLENHSVVAFYGPMGAGKTTLIKELCARMGVQDTVTSPTFALVNQYLAENKRTIYHFDFYRIDKIEEAYDLGYEEYFYSGDVCLVEWPEKVMAILPENTLDVVIEITGPDSRLIKIGSDLA